MAPRITPRTLPLIKAIHIIGSDNCWNPSIGFSNILQNSLKPERHVNELEERRPREPNGKSDAEDQDKDNRRTKGDSSQFHTPIARDKSDNPSKNKD